MRSLGSVSKVGLVVPGPLPKLLIVYVVVLKPKCSFLFRKAPQIPRVTGQEESSVQGLVFVFQIAIKQQ